MATTPSKTDDNDEIPSPGIYAIFGSYKENSDYPGGYQFAVYPSVVTRDLKTEKDNIRRTDIAVMSKDSLTTRRMEPVDLMEWDPKSEATFHPDVLDNIMIETPSEWEPEKKKGSMVAVSGANKWWEDLVRAEEEGLSNYSYGGPYKANNVTFKPLDRFDEQVEAAMKKHHVPHTSKFGMRSIMNRIDEELGEPTGDSFLAALDQLFGLFGLTILTDTEYNDLCNHEHDDYWVEKEEDYA